TISDAQAETWSSATAKLLSGITDDPDETCESFSNNAACSSIADERTLPHRQSGCASQQIQVTDVRFGSLADIP
ncbi:MAG: hypothetical protein WCD69_18335, partial [Xanthobacteraceae bacterium]